MPTQLINVMSVRKARTSCPFVGALIVALVTEIGADCFNYYQYVLIR